MDNRRKIRIWVEHARRMLDDLESSTYPKVKVKVEVKKPEPKSVSRETAKEKPEQFLKDIFVYSPTDPIRLAPPNNDFYYKIRYSGNNPRDEIIFTRDEFQKAKSCDTDTYRIVWRRYYDKY